MPSRGPGELAACGQVGAGETAAAKPLGDGAATEASAAHAAEREVTAVQP